MCKIIFFLTFVNIFIHLNCLAQSNLRFSENKGQWDNKVLFKADLQGAQLYIEKDNLHFNFLDPEGLDKIRQHKHGSCCGTDIITKDKDSTKNHKCATENHNHQETQTINAHSYRLKLIGSNPDVKVYGLNQQTGFENYYLGNDPSKWGSGVRSFTGILYKEIYHKIDLKVYSQNGNLKYDFIVFPGGNPSDIEYFYSGIDIYKHDPKRGIILKTSFSEITDHNPIVFQHRRHLSKSKNYIKASYEIDGNNVKFKIAKYDKNDTLIIDPELVFSTYSGSAADNWGYTATYDNDGNVYSGGIVNAYGYPVTEGAFQYEYGGPSVPGGWDVAIIKYSPDGSERLYATYLGGSETDVPHSMIVNSQNELIIFGTTGSSDFPILPDSYDNSYNGGTNITPIDGLTYRTGSDIFIAKLSADGTNLTGSTYLGGSGNDGLNIQFQNNYGDPIRGEVMIDEQDKIYIGTSTFSNDIVIQNGFMNTAPSGQKGILYKLNSNLTNVIWSSYFGGNEDDAIFSIDIDDNQNIFFTGATRSTDLPANANALHPNFLGGTNDSYIGKVLANGSQLDALTYYGSANLDMAFFVKLDENDNPVLFGQSNAPAGELVYNVGYSNDAQNGGQFVSSISNDLTTLNWSTRFGSDDGRFNISPTAFAVDICNRIYIGAGGRIQLGNYDFSEVEWVWSEDYQGYRATYLKGDFGSFDMAITQDAFQPFTDGQDFYIMVLGKDASNLEYATYYGQQRDFITYNFNTLSQGCYGGFDHVDGGTSRFDPRGNIYQAVCASCRGCQGLPMRENHEVWSNANNSTNCNNAVFRFHVGFGLLEADFVAPLTNCDNRIISFKNTSHLNSPENTTYEWLFGDGTSSTEKNPRHEFPNFGTYEVRLVVNDPTSCDISDTITKTITIPPNVGFRYLDTIHYCHGDTAQLGIDFIEGATYSWTPNHNISNTEIHNPIAWPREDFTYTLTIQDGACTKTFEQTVVYHTYIINIDSIIAAPNPICGEQISNITVYTDDEVTSYVWAFDPAFNNIANHRVDEQTFAFEPLTTTTLYLRVRGKYCNSEVRSSIEIRVDELDIRAGRDTIICYDSGAMIELSAINNTEFEVEYDWTPKRFIISGDGTPNPIAQPTVTTDFILRATAGECVTYDTMRVVVDNVPLYANVRDITCNGRTDGRIILSPADYDYLWSDGEISNLKNNLPAGRYGVSISSQIGCQRDTFFIINEPLPLRHQVSVTPVTCKEVCNGTISINTIGGTLPYSYLWHTGDTLDSLSKLCIRNYSLTITDVNNCEITDVVSIKLEEDYPYVKASATPPNVYLGQKTQLAATDKLPDDTYTYEWSPGFYIEDPKSAITFAKPEETIAYKVFVTDKYGCMSQGEVFIIVKDFVCDEPFIFIPNAFSPDGDGHNDAVGVFSNVLAEVYFAIYDRWGEMIFETTKANDLWDGTYKGKELPPAVFVYYMKATCVNDEEYVKKGNITLIR